MQKPKEAKQQHKDASYLQTHYPQYMFASPGAQGTIGPLGEGCPSQNTVNQYYLSSGVQSKPAAQNSFSQNIFTYQSSTQLYSVGICNRFEERFRLAVGSINSDTNNKIEVLELQNQEGTATRIRRLTQLDHTYPITRLQWIPDYVSIALTLQLLKHEDLFATSADYLRLWGWQQGTEQPSLKHLFSQSKNSDYCAPLSSMDWNRTDPHLIGTASIDTTCSIWDVEALALKTQLIAHDVEVFDISWAPNPYQFATCSSDGSVRLFDTRQLDHSTVQYESPVNNPILRVMWNRTDPNYLAVLTMDSPNISILDTRILMFAVSELRSHTEAVNALSWAPNAQQFLCSAGDDSKALIWDISQKEQDSREITSPVLSYQGLGEVSGIDWSLAKQDWVAITMQNKVQLLRV